MVLDAIEGTKKPKVSARVRNRPAGGDPLAGFDLQASFFTGFEPLPGLEMALTIQEDPRPGTHARAKRPGHLSPGELSGRCCCRNH